MGSDIQALTIASHEDDQLVMNPVMDLATAKLRLAKLQEFVKYYLVADEDYGTIPGTNKPTLMKPGADKLCDIYALADDYETIKEFSREDWDREPPLLDYTFKCTLTMKRNGRLVATGMGSCSSYESKYRWRDSKRLCPDCQQPTIIKGKVEYGGGWICFSKRGGCGSKFADDDTAITGQKLGRSPNEDVADVKNTLIKMAKKRAKVDAVLSATRSSGIFAQDLEDMARPEAAAAPVRETRYEPVPGNGHDKPAQATKTSELKLITKAQQQQLVDAAKDAGWQDNEVKSWLAGRYSFRSSREITLDKFDEILQALKNPSESATEQASLLG